MVSRLLGLLVTCYLLLVTFNVPVHAQTSSPSALPASSIQLPASIPPTSPIYTDLLVHNMFHTFSCLSIGSSIIGQPCLTYQITKDAQGAIQSVPILSSANLGGGLLGTTTGLIAGLYMNPPVRTVDYLASVGEGLGIVKPAHAQGVVGSGAQVLSPILKLWQVSRNISYVIMIIIFVIIGLMVMFRQRINPQTVITAQAALPGLVIGLILITFSYFFAALIADTAFIGTNLVGYYFTAARPSTTQVTSQGSLTDKLKGENVISIMSSLMKGIKKDDIVHATGILFSIFGEPDPRDTSNPATLLRTVAAVAAYQIGSSIGPAIAAGAAGLGCGIAALPFGPLTLAAVPTCAAIGNIAGAPIAGAATAALTWNNPGGMVGFALWVIAMAIIVYSMLKLLLRLINSFLSIIFLTITAPFHLLAAALPGRQGIATGWILNMLGNILAFPAVLAVFYFVAFLLQQSSGPLSVSDLGVVSAQAQGSTTQLVGDTTFPLFGGLEISFITILLAFGALVALPAIPDIIVRTVGRVGVAGQLIGQEISGSTRAGRGYVDQVQGVTGRVGGDIQKTPELFERQAGYQLVSDSNAPGGFRREWLQTPGKITIVREAVKPKKP